MANSSQFEAFKQTLKKVFMLDQADLDFGIYRIMNQKRDDIEKYLNENLKTQIDNILEENKSSQATEWEKELKEAEKAAETLGISPDDMPKVKDLREKLKSNGNIEDLENEVYSQLATFFSRYYDSGDFISQRRYKKDVYAIPYEGEEVKLHWANADQYYIKTGEYFRTYRFKLDSGKCVEFTLKEATTEQNNNKAQDNMERRFALYKECPVEELEDGLHINFTYELYPKAIKQKSLIETAYANIKDILPREYQLELLVSRPTESDRKRTLLQKHLNDYVARNTFDYFIHKDLKGFLSRELDFYIKNEILEIDDIDSRSPESFMSHLTVIKAIKNIGAKLIAFLASLENFQKRLWLKKKMVVSADYCITLDRVPQSLYPEICANDAQREEWVKLFAIDKIKAQKDVDIFSQKASVGYSTPLSVEFLKENPYLVLDTAFYSESFKRTLISSIDDLDEQCNGLMINSDNFHALTLLQEKFNRKVKCVYIDPPYNSPSSEIAYKNSFKHSSWLSLLNDRLNLSRNLLKEDGSHVVAIDKYEHIRLFQLIDSLFPNNDNVSVAIEHNKKGVMGDRFSYNNEYAVFSVPTCRPHLNEMLRNEEDWDWSAFRNWGGESLRSDAANCFFPIYVKGNTIIGYGEVVANDIHPQANVILKDTFSYYDYYGKVASCKLEKGESVVAIFPVDVNGIERKWRYAFQTMPEIISRLRVRENRDGVLNVEIPKCSDQFKTLWYGSKYNAGDYGTKILTNLGIDKSLFKFPKSIYTTRDCIYAVSEKDDIILDFFAGSGTTGHVVINLNQDDDGHRKFILVEMGDYFSTVTRPRIEKVIYSNEWQNGEPLRKGGGSNCFKYVRLEQYEDTLNNLVVKKNPILHNTGEFYDGFMLGYLLDTETKDSLFSLDWFVDPWNTKLNITQNNEIKEEKIDLIETFNYLIGLNVQKITYPKDDICVVEGYNPKEEHVLVIWRNCNNVSNSDLDDFFNRMAYSTRDQEFDKIYVNGDNNLENLKTAADTWKVSLIEQEFSKKMFEAE